MKYPEKSFINLLLVSFLIAPAIFLGTLIVVAEMYVRKNQKTIILQEFQARSNLFVNGFDAKIERAATELAGELEKKIKQYTSKEVGLAMLPDAEQRNFVKQGNYQVVAQALQAIVAEKAIVSQATLAFRNADGKLLTLADSETGNTAIVAGNALPVFLQSSKNEKEFFADNENLLNFMTLLKSEKITLYLRLQSDQSNFASANTLRLVIFLTVSMVLYLLFLLIWRWLRKNISENLTEIHASTDLALKGEYNNTLELSGVTELTQLGDKLNALTADFKSRVSLLENNFHLAGRFIPEGLADLLGVKSGLQLKPGTFKKSAGYVLVAVLSGSDEKPDQVLVDQAEKTRRLLSEIAHRYEGHLLESRLPAFVLFFPAALEKILGFGKELAQKLQPTDDKQDSITEDYSDLKISTGVSGGDLMVTALRDNFDTLEITYYGKAVQQALKTATMSQKARALMMIEVSSVKDADMQSMANFTSASTRVKVKRGKTSTEIVRVNF